jgi:hypothetical protein
MAAYAQGGVMLGYREDDLSGKLQGYLVKARGMVKEDAKHYADEGSAVLGAGIALNLIPKGCSKPRKQVVIGAPFQGNVGSLRACRRAIDWLHCQGVAVYWYDGIMD